MKKLGILFMLFMTLVSCSNNSDDNSQSSEYGKWKLTSMRSIKNPAVNSIDVMEWQESYTFNDNSTFSKTRIKDGKTATVSGTYTVTKTIDQIQFELSYTAQNEIIGSCTGNLKENLYIINSVGKLFNTWGVCDGPLLTYEKI